MAMIDALKLVLRHDHKKNIRMLHYNTRDLNKIKKKPQISVAMTE